jgi:hypothetical protein
MCMYVYNMYALLVYALYALSMYGYVHRVSMHGSYRQGYVALCLTCRARLYKKAVLS